VIRQSPSAPPASAQGEPGLDPRRPRRPIAFALDEQAVEKRVALGGEPELQDEAIGDRAERVIVEQRAISSPPPLPRCLR